MPPDETVRRHGELGRRLGITRIADVTGLDRIGIPTFSAIVPDSGDYLSVYMGKGSRRADARAGALMEAIERQSALKARPQLLRGSVSELRSRTALIDPATLVTALREDYSESRVYDWVAGYDLLNDCETLVPAACAGYMWNHLREPGPVQRTTTHGLSAGNCLEETVSQALCEWVERDAWTIAEVLCHWRPRAILETMTGLDPGSASEDDREPFPCLSLEGIGEPVDGLLARFRRAGLEPVVRDLTVDLGIPVVVASVAEDAAPGFPQVHMGIGAHPDLRVAASRALTEAAQSRCGDIQAMREDIEQHDSAAPHVGGHTRRTAFIDRRRWVLSRSTRERDWRDVPEQRNADILDDIRLLLARLRRAGIRQAVMVDLSPPDSSAVVLRMMVPGLEMWIVDRGRLGERAASHWRAAGSRAAHA